MKGRREEGVKGGRLEGRTEKGRQEERKARREEGGETNK